jgi:hypothetical protein
MQYLSICYEGCELFTPGQQGQSLDASCFLELGQVLYRTEFIVCVKNKWSLFLDLGN